jgi:hypothetical protein
MTKKTIGTEMDRFALAADVKTLDVVSNSRELRRDIHVFVNYIRERDVKRTHRSNDLQKSDIKRLAKLIGDRETMAEVQATGTSPWIDFIDRLARTLGFVRYDIEGEYRGYTSTSVSYPENYIRFREQTYEQFLNYSPIEQEECILNALIKRYDDRDNEFFSNTCSLSVLDRFDTFGCATGVVPSIRFDKARMYLLGLLKECKSGVWYSTASFIKYLKKEHPFFLIPQNVEVEDRWWNGERYCNFHERGELWGRGETIPDNAPDAFERVEGRFVERFLENIPLTMRYLDVAYDKAYERREKYQSRYKRDTYMAILGKENKASKTKKQIYPSINQLKAFRVNDRFLRVMNREIRKPKVTVLPNFEIHVDSDIYPVNVMAQLTPFADVIADDVAIVLKLKKKKVAAQIVEHEDLNVISLLDELAEKKLPPNILTHLEDWTAHAEMFTLFDGFGLLECDEKLGLADGFTVENITPNIKIVRSPAKLFAQLESAELVPVLVKHPDSSVRPPEKGVRSVFCDASPKKKRQKKAVNIKKKKSVTLYFPSKTLLNRFAKELTEAKLPFGLNELTNSITFSESREPQLEAVFKAMGTEYSINIEDVG